MRLLVSFIMATVIRVKACPVTCECNDFSHDPLQNDIVYTTVTCRNTTNFTDIPITTNKIILSHISYFDIKDFLQNFQNNFKKFPILFHASFTHCSISNISHFNFKGLEQLESFDLSRNKLKYLFNTGSVFNLTNLKTLDLSNNEIHMIEDYQFNTLSSLGVLNLSANVIETLSENAFIGLSRLLCLDISSNKLSTIRSSNFIPLLTLQYLNLSNNLLQVLDEAGLGNLQKLQQLDVSWNRLTRVTPGSLQLPSLSRLLLVGNPALGKLNESALLVGPGKRLQIVDVSQTGLTQVPAALTQSVRTLQLSGNSIQTVNCGHLDSYPLLQTLDFTSNNLEDIEDDALGRLDSLSILYLSDNKLRSIPRHLPEKLKILHLQHNLIERVFLIDLQGLQILETLLLYNNKISTIQDETFSQLKNLIALDLSKNLITSLPTGTLSGLWQLKILRLTNLKVNAPAQDMAFPLSTPEHLQILDLSNSPGLAKQFLADTSALIASKELREINLSGGNITHIRSDLLHYLPQLKILILHNNSLDCSEFRRLTQWIKNQNQSNSNKIVCANSKNFSNIFLVDLQNATLKPKPVEKLNYVLYKINNTVIPTNITEKLHKEDKEPLILHQNVAQIKSTHENHTDQRKHGDPNKANTFKNKTSTIHITNAINLSKLSSRVFAKEEIKKWENVSATGKLFMFSETNRWQNFRFPGILIISVALLIIMIVLIAFAFTLKRNLKSFQQHDVEISSLASVTDLW